MILKNNEAESWLEINSPYFKSHELKCRCGCQLVIDTDSVEKLNKLRIAVDAPLVITSSFRCPAHNKKVGGASQSKHLNAIAFDIWTPGLDFQNKVLDEAIQIFNGVIVYHNKTKDTRWIHVDNHSLRYFKDQR